MISIQEIPHFTSDLSPQEIALLLSADARGRIPFPEGNPRNVSVYLNALLQLDEKQLIRRRMENGWRPYCLTESGKAIKSRLAGSKN